jgi:hypothetical protein
MIHLKILAITAVCVALAGCGPDMTRQWREEVVLSDGTPITTSRTATWDEDNFLSLKRLYIKKLDDKVEVEKKGAINVPSPFVEKGDGTYPFLIDRLPNGTWVVVTYIWDCSTWDAMGKPPSQHIEHQYIDGTWKRMPTDSNELHGRHGNLLLAPAPDGERGPYEKKGVLWPSGLYDKERIKRIALKEYDSTKKQIFIDPSKKPSCDRYPR